MAVFGQVHDIVFYGGGGYDWDTVYNFPLWLRKYTFNRIQKTINDRNDQSSGDIVETTRNNIRSAGFDRSQKGNTVQLPDYITKASKTK
jgi:hypothetical protein